MRVTQQEYDFVQNILVPLSASGLSTENELQLPPDTTLEEAFAPFPAFLKMIDKMNPDLRKIRYLENFGFQLIFLHNWVIFPTRTIKFYPDPRGFGENIEAYKWVAMQHSSDIQKITYGIDNYRSRNPFSRKVTKVSVMRLETNDDFYFTVAMPLLEAPDGEKFIVSKLQSISKHWPVQLTPRETSSQR